jgi:hypothetical protein
VVAAGDLGQYKAHRDPDPAANFDRREVSPRGRGLGGIFPHFVSDLSENRDRQGRWQHRIRLAHGVLACFSFPQPPSYFLQLLH